MQGSFPLLFFQKYYAIDSPNLQAILALSVKDKPGLFIWESKSFPLFSSFRCFFIYTDVYFPTPSTFSSGVDQMLLICQWAKLDFTTLISVWSL